MKAAGHVSPAPEPIKTPRVTHSLFALQKKLFKVIDCDVIVSSGLLPQPEKSKKMQAK